MKQLQLAKYILFVMLMVVYLFGIFTGSFHTHSKDLLTGPSEIGNPKCCNSHYSEYSSENCPLVLFATSNEKYFKDFDFIRSYRHLVIEMSGTEDFEYTNKYYPQISLRGPPIYT